MMKKLATFCLIATVLCASGIAVAAAVKIALVPYPAAPGVAEPDASGQTILNYAKGKDKTEVQVNCWGLTPGTEYVVYAKPGGWQAIGSFTARKNGSGNVHVRLDGDFSGALPVAVNNAALNATVLISE